MERVNWEIRVYMGPVLGCDGGREADVWQRVAMAQMVVMVGTWLGGCSEAAPGRAALQAGASTVVFSGETANHDFLQINTLVLRAAGPLLAFVAIDGIGVGPMLVEAVAEKLGAAGSRIAREGLLLSASHSHGGGLCCSQQGLVFELALGTFDPQRLDAAAELIAGALGQAEAELQAARFRVGAGAAPEYQENRSIEGGYADPEMLLLHVEALDGIPIAWLVNFAAHPTVLYDAEGELGRGRDFPGGLTSELQRISDSDVPVLFVNAAAANVGPAWPESDTLGQGAFRMGQALAQRAATLRDAAEPQIAAEFSVELKSSQLPRSLLGDAVPGKTVLTEVRFNDMVLLSLPGEAASQIGRTLKDLALARGADRVFLLGYTNNYLAYHPHEEEYFQGTYEAMMCLYGPLMNCWYATSHFPELVDEPFSCSPLLAAHRRTYERGVELGRAERETIAARWAARTEGKCEGDLAALQVNAFLDRETLMTLTDEQRATLIGVAEGAELAFDIVVLLQYEGAIDVL